MTIARVVDGQIVELRHDITLDNVPAHKRSLWLGVPEKPMIDHRMQVLSGSSLSGGDVVWTVSSRSRDDVIVLVRAEAQRRIVALMNARDLEHCLIKQLNANMRANQLNDKRVSGEVLSVEEEVEASALRIMAAAIQAIRAKSNILEAASPIPADFTDDAHWA